MIPFTITPKKKKPLAYTKQTNKQTNQQTKNSYKTNVCIVKNPVMLKEIKEDPNEWRYAVFTV